MIVRIGRNTSSGALHIVSTSSTRLVETSLIAAAGTPLAMAMTRIATRRPRVPACRGGLPDLKSREAEKSHRPVPPSAGSVRVSCS